MRLINVDESYCKICYYVATQLVPDTNAQALTAALDTVVRRAEASCSSHPAGDPEKADVHDYLGEAGNAIPYGIHQLP